jgi:hypothetical protein
MDGKKLRQKWYLAYKITPIILMVLILKILAHIFGLETMEMNQLMTSIVAGTIFLLGFLISGVLTDYKESERTPGDLASALEALYDDAWTISQTKGHAAVKDLMAYESAFISSLLDWFYRKERSRNIMAKIGGFSEFFAEFEKAGIPIQIIVRMKTEQNNIRRMIIRIHTIRDTNFIPSAYAIVEVLSFFLVFSMIIIKLEPFHEAVLFTLLVTFLVSYMLFLIRDLDNPFDYVTRGETGVEVSLKPIRDLGEHLRNKQL